MTSPEITEIMNDAETVVENYPEIIKRLAVLPMNEYEPIYKDEAKRLNMRPGVLDKEVKAARDKEVKPSAGLRA